MGDVSDIAELLPKAQHQVFVKKTWAVVKMLCVMGSAFAGAGWTAHQYLEQLATKEDVAKLLRGQDDKIGNMQASISALNDRLTRAETRVDDIRGGMVIRR